MVAGMLRALATLAVVGIISVGGAGAAHADWKNWGQEVKDCNATSCYPGGETRGGYVNVQARDTESPGYAWEIHAYATPGKSTPTLP